MHLGESRDAFGPLTYPKARSNTRTTVWHKFPSFGLIFGPFLSNLAQHLASVWKFQDFSIPQILCEINLKILEVQNQPFLHILRRIEYYILSILDYSKAEINQINKIQSHKNWQKRQC